MTPFPPCFVPFSCRCCSLARAGGDGDVSLWERLSLLFRWRSQLTESGWRHASALNKRTHCVKSHTQHRKLMLLFGSKATKYEPCISSEGTKPDSILSVLMFYNSLIFLLFPLFFFLVFVYLCMLSLNLCEGAFFKKSQKKYSHIPHCRCTDHWDDSLIRISFSEA